MATAIFYASSTGNTSEAAGMISREMGDDVEVFDIASTGVEKMMEFDKLIIGTSTWGDGNLQDDFEEYWDDFCKLDFGSKTVALFGLGDQDGYGDYYLDAMGTIYEQVISRGATVIGEVEVGDEYFHEESKAQRGNKFVGLALDEDNQSELTVSSLSTEFISGLLS